jgi:4-alpha-glucanotransferase
LTATSRTARQLSELAQIHGVQLGYTAQGGKRVTASRETLLAVLAALGHPVSDSASIERELATARRRRRENALEPVNVRRADRRLTSPVSLAARLDPAEAWLTVRCEDDSVLRRRLTDVSELSDRQPVDPELTTFVVDLSDLDLAAGYHRLELEHGRQHAEALLLVPPPPPEPRPKGFGVFASVSGLRGRSDWGVGSYRDLADFADLVGGWGGELVGTLPLFPAYFRTPVDPSPYLPVSRKFWNELYVDVESLPELDQAQAGRTLIDSTAFQSDLESLRAGKLADHGPVMAHKRVVLEACADALTAWPGSRRDEFEAFVKGHPELESYADFRAAEERLGVPWRTWPTTAGSPDADTDASRYHRYAQFVAAEQIAAAADRRGGKRAGLYLDLPVGVHPDGFDTWSSPELFAGAGVGAPPDAFFSGGQSWGFPPLHPQRMRLDGYRYLIASYRHVLSHARAVRIDHVLGLQRLFWIPDGCGPDAGAYVRYPSEELRAIIALEAARTDTVVIGEDLGTVSAEIRHAMDRDGMLHSFVYQFEASADQPLPQPRKPSVASLGSHDLPPFAAFWRGTDIAERHEHGWIDSAAASRERKERKELVTAVLGSGQEQANPASDAAVRAGLRICLSSLAGGPAEYVMADLADLELEMTPDNRPGTGPEADNWRRRMTRPLADIASDRWTADLMSDIAARRSTADTEGAGA